MLSSQIEMCPAVEAMAVSKHCMALLHMGRHLIRHSPTKERLPTPAARQQLPALYLHVQPRASPHMEVEGAVALGLRPEDVVDQADHDVLAACAAFNSIKILLSSCGPETFGTSRPGLTCSHLDCVSDRCLTA